MREFKLIEKGETRSYVAAVRCDSCGKHCKMAGSMGMYAWGEFKYVKQGCANHERQLDLCADCVNTALDTLGLHYDVPVQEPQTDEQAKAYEKRRAEKGQGYLGP